MNSECGPIESNFQSREQRKENPERKRSLVDCNKGERDQARPSHTCRSDVSRSEVNQHKSREKKDKSRYQRAGRRAPCGSLLNLLFVRVRFHVLSSRDILARVLESAQ